MEAVDFDYRFDEYFLELGSSESRWKTGDGVIVPTRNLLSLAGKSLPSKQYVIYRSNLRRQKSRKVSRAGAADHVNPEAILRLDATIDLNDMVSGSRIG